MASMTNSHWLSVFFVVAILLLFVGCIQKSVRQTDVLAPPGVPVDIRGDIWHKANPCGSLPIVAPLINVSGSVRAAVCPGAQLFVLRNDSFDTALYTVAHCAPLMRIPVNATGDFTFPALPAAEYLVMLPGNAFENNTQRFPLIAAYNASGLAVRMLWHGGNSTYSLAAFSVELIAS